MNEDNYSDELLKRLFETKTAKIESTLEELFDERLVSLQVSKTTALRLMGMTTRTLKGILYGKQKKLDNTQLIKLSNFLGIPLVQVAKLYLEKLQKVHNLGEGISKEIQFINEKFNLAEFKKVGIIKSLADYDDIIKSICNYFGLDKVVDYKEPEINIVFSAGKRAKRNCSIQNWVYLAEKTCIELRNANTFNREKLIEYFPQIRWHSMNVDNGLVNVIKQLFQLGITVVFIPSFPSLHVRGATFCVNNKPCIVLTDYVGFYPTIWYALIHELFHVLFDWNDIKEANYHISLKDGEYFDRTSENEKEADSFARQYLFSKEKTKIVEPFINDHEYIKEFAIANHVDPSFIYVFTAFDAPKSNKFVWGRAKKYNPKLNKLKGQLQNFLDESIPFNQHIKKIRTNIYN